MTDRQKAVAELQQWLRNISRSKSDAPSIIPDGIFSAETRLEVERFQRENGLPVTGAVDYTTWEAIKKSERIAVADITPPVQVAPIANSDLPLVRGMNNIFTDTLKLMLNRVAQQYDAFGIIDEEGFGAQTEAKVRRWQEIAFIDVTGEADKSTWNSLARFYLIT